jgi:hypothetical protein
MKIDELAAAISLGRVRITNRADEEIHGNGMTMDQVCKGIAGGSIIEQLETDDRPYPGCRVSAQLPDGTAVESVWAWNARTGWAALVNAYRTPATGVPEEGSA